MAQNVADSRRGRGDGGASKRKGRAAAGPGSRLWAGIGGDEIGLVIEIAAGDALEGPDLGVAERGVPPGGLQGQGEVVASEGTRGDETDMDGEALGAGDAVRADGVEFKVVCGCVDEGVGVVDEINDDLGRVFGEGIEGLRGFLAFDDGCVQKAEAFVAVVVAVVCEAMEDGACGTERGSGEAGIDWAERGDWCGSVRSDGGTRGEFGGAAGGSAEEGRGGAATLDWVNWRSVRRGRSDDGLKCGECYGLSSEDAAVMDEICEGESRGEAGLKEGVAQEIENDVELDFEVRSDGAGGEVGWIVGGEEVEKGVLELELIRVERVEGRGGRGQLWGGQLDGG